MVAVRPSFRPLFDISPDLVALNGALKDIAALEQAGYVPSSREVSAGAGVLGGGDLTNDRSFALDPSTGPAVLGVEPGVDVQPFSIFLSAIDAAPSAPGALTLSGSPHTYTNATDRWVQAVVSGGTVTLIELSHNGSAWIDAGVIAGAFVVNPGYRLRVTYSVAPTVTILEM